MYIKHYDTKSNEWDKINTSTNQLINDLINYQQNNTFIKESPTKITYHNGGIAYVKYKLHENDDVYQTHYLIYDINKDDFVEVLIDYINNHKNDVQIQFEYLPI